MIIEKRAHLRYRVEGLTATVTLAKPDQESVSLDGQVLDISSTGIKILLNSPFPDAEQAQINIGMVLPETGIPITIKGIVKYLGPSSEIGLYCGDDTPEAVMDKLLFECFKAVRD